MTNIALLNRCNLKCPYCFASSYTGDEREDIKVPNFEELLDFCAPDKEVGIIGGEPLMHKSFDLFLDILKWDMRFNRVTIFTNGLLIDKHLEALCSPNL